MRGMFLRHHRKRRLFALAVITMILFVTVKEPYWVKRIVEDKVTDFLGNRFSVEVGQVSGGIFRDMVLQDVAFMSKQQVFRLERMEVSYRLWQVFLDKARLAPGSSQLKYVRLYFSGENPFVRGFAKLEKYPGRIEVSGSISPVLFGQKEKKGIKGVFLKQTDGKYECELLWNGQIKMIGTLDPDNKAIEVRAETLLKKRGKVSISGKVSEEKTLEMYTRLDKVSIGQTEVIGDIWVTYRDFEKPVFDVKIESLVINKLPVWDITVGGRFEPSKKTVFLDSVKWGEGIDLRGFLKIEDPYPAELRLSIKDVDIEEMFGMFQEGVPPLIGNMEAEIGLHGPLAYAEVDGRLYIGEGSTDVMDFRSMFATLKGKLPVIKISDSRIIKEGGNIIVSGEMDFSRAAEGKVFEGIVYDTDNKVAVWEDWQISKEEKGNTVEAQKDRFVVSTTFEDDCTWDKAESESFAKKEMGFAYKIDPSNSIKLEFKDEKDFLGLEHKVEF